MPIIPRSGGSSSFHLGGGGGYSAPVAPKPHGSHGFGGFIHNVVSDVRNSVIGIPMGIKVAATHPIRAAEQMGKSEWQTWSPLFQGHYGQFAHNTYAHPLAPVLDVATVFSLGMGSAARIASGLERAGVESSSIAKLASLRKARGIELTDPKPKILRATKTKPEKIMARPTFTRHLSQRAGRRAVQEFMLGVDNHLPNLWGVSEKYVAKKAAIRYEAHETADIAHRIAAKNLMVAAVLKAGKALSDKGTAGIRSRAELFAGLVLNVHRHAHEMDFNTAVPAHYAIVRHPALVVREDLEESQKLGREIKAIDSAHVQADKIVEKSQRNAGFKTPEQNQEALYLERGMTHVKEEMAARRVEALNRQMALDHRSWTDNFTRLAEDPAKFEENIKSLNLRMFTKNKHEAALTDEGKILVVPIHDMKNIMGEAHASSKFFKWAYKNPTLMWKTLLLGYTPRIVTNNGIGNWMIAMSRELGQQGSVIGLHDAFRLLYGKKRAAGLLAETPFKKHNWMYRYFSDELGNAFARTLDETPLRGPARKIASRGRQGFYPAVYKTSEEPVRAYTIASYLRRSPEVRAYMHQGKSFDQAVESALKHDKGLRERAVHHARTTSGDYISMNAGERVLRDLVPFYLWDRHILKSTGNLVADTPGRAVFLQNLSHQGLDETQKLLGRLPDFLRGALPIGHTSDGRANMILTQSLNPFATISDLFQAGEGLTTGGGLRPQSALFSQMNPAVSGAVEWASGQSLLTGATKKQHGGLLPSIITAAGEGLPEYKIADAALHGTTRTGKKGAPLLFEHGFKATGTGALGIPVRSVSLAAALKIAKEEQGIKVSKAKKGKKGGFKLHG